MVKFFKKSLLTIGLCVSTIGASFAYSGQIMLQIDDDCQFFSDVTTHPLKFVVRGNDNLAFENFSRADYVQNAMVRGDTGAGQMHAFDVPLFELVYAQKLSLAVPVLNYRVINPPPFFRVGVVYNDGRGIGSHNSTVIDVSNNRGVVNATIDGKSVFQLGDLYCRLLKDDIDGDGTIEVIVNCRCTQPFR